MPTTRTETPQESTHGPKPYHCPFCRNRSPRILTRRDGTFTVECPRCGARGPGGRGISDTPEDAIAAWNAKAGPAARAVFRHEVRPV